MNASTSRNRARPLAPHLQVWRWGPAMAVSILHRAAGEGMAWVGIPVFLWFLYALSAGPEAWVTFTSWIWPDLSDNTWGSAPEILYSLFNLALRLVLIGLSWAFFQHLSSGLRHFVLDVGAGYELDTNTMWSWIVPAIGIVFTVLFWAAIYLR